MIELSELLIKVCDKILPDADQATNSQAWCWLTHLFSRRQEMRQDIRKDELDQLHEMVELVRKSKRV